MATAVITPQLLDSGTVLSYNGVVISVLLDATLTQANGGTYPTPSTNQLSLSCLYWRGWDYPTAIRPQDSFEQVPPPVVQTAISGATSSQLQINWNTPTYLDENGATQTFAVNNFEIQIGTNSSFNAGTYSTYTVAGSATSAIIPDLSAGTTYYARIKARLNTAQTGVYQRSIYYSNTVNANTSGSSFFGTALALNPLYAYDFRASTDVATTVPNQGTAGGTAAKSGTFTKASGLIAGASAQVLTTLPGLVRFGDTTVGGQDWVWIVRFKVPTTQAINGNLYTNYKSTAVSTERLRMRNGATSGGTTNDGFLNLGQNNVSPAATPATLAIGTQQINTMRTVMLMKVGATLTAYQAGSTTAVNTYTLTAGVTFDFDRFIWFAGAPGSGSGVVIDLEIEYSVIHYEAALDSTEQTNWKNTMLATP